MNSKRIIEESKNALQEIERDIQVHKAALEGLQEERRKLNAIIATERHDLDVTNGLG